MPRFLFPLEYSTELLMPSLPCLRACSLDRFPQESRSPCADGCSPVRASWSLAPPTSKAIPNSNDILLVGEDTEFLFSSVLEICLVFVAQRRASSARLHPSFFYPRFDLSALLMLPLTRSTDYLSLRAAIGLFEPLGLAPLGGYLPLPLSLRRTTTRAFSGYRAVRGTR